MSKEVYSIKEISLEEAQEMSLIDLAYGIFKESNQPMNFHELMQEVANLRGMSEEEIRSVIAILYTEINVDGRFIFLGNNTWGLKRWYPVDKAVEKSASGKKFVRKNDDQDHFGDDDDDSYVDDDVEEDDSDHFDKSDDEDDPDYEDADDIDDADNLDDDDSTDEDMEDIEDEDSEDEEED